MQFLRAQPGFTPGSSRRTQKAFIQWRNFSAQATSMPHLAIPDVLEMQRLRGGVCPQRDKSWCWGSVSLATAFDLDARHSAARKDHSISAFRVQEHLLEIIRSTVLFPSFVQAKGESCTQATSSSPKKPTQCCNCCRQVEAGLLAWTGRKISGAESPAANQTLAGWR